jgi:hypothetical protein
MPFLEKLADIAMWGQHVGNMSATFPAKLNSRNDFPWWHISWSLDAKVDILLVLFSRIFLKDGTHPKHPYHLKGVQVVV